jgi:hypothetical protein
VCLFFHVGSVLRKLADVNCLSRKITNLQSLQPKHSPSLCRPACEVLNADIFFIIPDFTSKHAFAPRRANYKWRCAHIVSAHS